MLLAKTRPQQAGEGTTTTVFSHQAWFSFSLLGQDICANPAAGTSVVPRRVCRNLWAPAVQVNTSPNTHCSEVLEVSVNLGVHVFCQNEVSRLCRWLCFAVKEERGETPPEAITAAVAACLLPALCCGLAAPRREMAFPGQEEEELSDAASLPA